MPAEVLKQIAAPLDCLVNIKVGYRASRACNQFRRLGQDHRRTVIFLGQARCNDPNHPFMPFGIVDDNCFPVLLILETLDDGIGFIRNFLVQLATFFIILVNAFALLLDHRTVFGEQQLNGFAPVHHSSRGIDARTDLKDNIADSNLLAAQTADIDDALESETRIAVDLLQSVVCQDAVLTRDRNNVRGYADRRQLQQFFQLGEGEFIVDGKRLHELEPHATPRQMFVGIA